MAKVLSRKVTIYINGKEVENTIRSLEAEAAKLRAQQRNLVIGSEEYIETSRKLKEIKDVLAQQKNAVEGVADAYGEARKKAAEWSNIVVGMKTLWQKGSDLFNWLKGFSDEAARMDDVYADVMKTTGLTRDEVLRLNEAFKGMDTRTSREQLNQLAYEAGKLGINSAEAVAQFVSASDKINIALGDVLGEGAMVTIGKLTEIFESSTKALEGKNLEEKMLAIGSAVNSLGQASTANEGYMVEFMKRLGGIAAQAGLSADQILGFASALDQNGQAVEMSATAFTKMIMQMVKKPEEFVKAAGVSIDEFKRMMDEDMNGTILRVLEGMDSQGGFQQIVHMFNEMGLDGSRAAQAISSLAKHLDQVREAQALASREIATGSSVVNEFNTKNNTMQARLDKAKDTFHDTAEALGNALYPAMIGVTNAGSGLMSAASGLIGFLREYPAVLSPLVAMGGAWLALKLKTAAATVAEKAAELVMLPVKRTRQALEQRQIMLEQKKLEAYHRNRQAEYLEMINKEKLILTDKAYAATEEGLARREQAEANIKAYSTNATQHADAADKAHTATIRAKNAAMKATPWGLIIGLATTLATVIYKLATAESDLEKATKEANRQVFEEQGRLKVLRERMEGAAEGSEEYMNALGDLRAMHPEIVSLYVDEKGHIEDLTGMYKALGEAAAASVYQRMYAEKASELQGELGEKLQDRMEWFGKKVNRVFSDLSEAEKLHIKQEINNILKEAADGETELVDLTVRLRDLLLGSGLSISSTAYSVMMNELFKMRGEANLTTQALKEMQTSLKATDPDPFGVQKKSLKELEAELANVLEAMERGFSEGAEKDAARLKALRDQIAKLKKSSIEDETPGGGNGNYSGDETPAQRKAREKREREEAAWERFGQNYERLIDKMNTKTLSGAAKVVADVDQEIRKMNDDLELILSKHPEAQGKIDQLKQMSDEWKKTKIGEYLKKAESELTKLQDGIKKPVVNEQLAKVQTATKSLEEQFRKIDEAILQYTEDLKTATPEEMERLNRLIEGYRQLKGEMVTATYSQLFGGGKTVRNDEWSGSVQGKVDAAARSPYSSQFDTQSLLAYGNALKKIEDDFIKQRKSLEDEIEKEEKALKDLIAEAKTYPAAITGNTETEIAQREESIAAIRKQIDALSDLQVQAEKAALQNALTNPLASPQGRDTWSDSVKGKVDEMASSPLLLIVNPDQLNAYGEALAEIEKKYNDLRSKKLMQKEAEDAVVKSLEEQIEAERGKEKEEQNKDLIASLEEQKKQHEQNAAIIQQEVDSLGQLREEAEEIAKQNAFGKWLDKLIAGIERFAGAAMEIWGNLNRMLDNFGEAERIQAEKRKDNAIDQLDEQLKEGVISQEEYEQQKNDIQQEYDDKEKEIQKEAWRRQKQLNTSQAVMESALAILKAWNSAPWPANAVPLALATAMGIAQVAAIASEPEPYAKGGYVSRRTVYQAGEAGPEWVASNSLLSDPATAPIIEQLEAYQRGNRRALADIPMAQINMPVATRAAQELGRRRSLAESSVASAVGSISPNVSVQMPDNGEMLRLWRELATYLKDPKNRQAVISRQTMTDFEGNENFLRNRARL